MVPYLIVAVLALSSFVFRKLTLTAAITAFVVASLIFLGAGYNGLAMLAAFFVLGVAATGWHKRDKKMLKSAADQNNRRDAWQVLANGGVAALGALLACIFPLHQQLFNLMLAGSLAAATADTLSSELGMVYGRRFYNVITFKPDQKGLDGVVSLEGTLIGLVGAALIALISESFWAVAIAGIVGNYVDSLLGATLEYKGILNNNQVNFLATLTGALVALLFYYLVTTISCQLVVYCLLKKSCFMIHFRSKPSAAVRIVPLP